MRVLVVDDNADVADSVSAYIEEVEPSWRIRTVYAGDAALDDAVRFRPDVVILDLAMPDMTGYELARRLRQEFDDRVTLVALTGYVQARELGHRGALDFVVLKPADIEDLIKLIKSHTRRAMA